MPTGSEIVRLSEKTGSDGWAVRTTRLNRSGLPRVLRCLQNLREDLQQPSEGNAPHASAKPRNADDINRRIGEAAPERDQGYTMLVLRLDYYPRLRPDAQCGRHRTNDPDPDFDPMTFLEKYNNAM